MNARLRPGKAPCGDFGLIHPASTRPPQGRPSGRSWGVLALLALGACATPSSPAAPPVAWEPKPRVLAPGRDPALAISASETPAIVWGTPSSDLAYARSGDGGDLFSKPQTVNATEGEVKAHGESAPWLRMGPGQELFAAWEGAGDIRFARSTNFGRSFGEPVRLDDGPEKSHQSFLHLDSGPDGTVAVAWLDFRAEISVYVAVSRDKGATWSPNVKVAGAVCPCCRPAVAVAADGAVVCVWRHVYPTNVRDLAGSVSGDGGRTWSAPVRVSVDDWVLEGCPHSGASIAFSGGTLGAVWYTGAGTRASLRFATSADLGATWSAPSEIQGPHTDANHPHLIAAFGDFWAIFQARDGSENAGWGPVRARVARLSPGRAPELSSLPSTGSSVAYPRLAAGSAGRLYAAWTESDAAGPRVVLCRGRAR